MAVGVWQRKQLGCQFSGGLAGKFALAVVFWSEGNIGIGQGVAVAGVTVDYGLKVEGIFVHKVADVSDFWCPKSMRCLVAL